MPTIKSSTDLRNNYNSISTYCHESREPVFITKNGQGDLAVMSIEVYETLKGKLELYYLLETDWPNTTVGHTPSREDALLDLGQGFHRPTPEEKKAAMDEFRALMAPIDGSTIDLKQLRMDRRVAKYERND